MLMGSIVHRALELYWNDFDKAIEYVNREKFPILNANNYGYMEKCTSNFFKNFKHRVSGKEVVIEQFFKLPLDDNVFLVGKIDRISDGNIYDWKTSQRVPTDLDNDIQLMIYHYAYMRTYGKKPEGVFYGILSQGVLVPYKFNKFYFSELFDSIIPEVVDKVRNNSLNKDGLFRKGSCHRCPYIKHCVTDKENDGMVSGTLTKE